MSIASEITGSIAPLPRDDLGASRVFAGITPDLYADLRRLARCFMRSERGGHTLQPTAVVNEAFLRLSRADIRLKDTLHLYRLVAQTMRRVLVDHARERNRMKRDPTRDVQAEPVTEPGPPFQSAAPLDILDIDAALNELADRMPRAAALLELRYFAGLEDVEISELYGISRATVEREFRFAKAFLVAYGRRERLTVGAS
ncbi:MAG TPA: ECF-type sigma factor [Gammaproteobacteria bacterium]|nr:ECF-type sigma factor [Gammaproteobacteria bacterium]